MVIHFPAAAHEEALGHVLAAIAAAAGQLQLFQQMNALALHLAIANQIKRGGEPGQAGADDISGFFIHALGLFRMCEGFIGASGIIHSVKPPAFRRFNGWFIGLRAYYIQPAGVLQ